MNTRLLIATLLPALALLCPLSVRAQHQIHPDHVPLQQDPSLDFRQILQQALEHAPQALEEGARESQAQAYAGVGRSWLAGRPALTLSLYDDALLDDVGLGEREFGVQLPLWRPGEWRAAREQGERYGEQLDIWRESLEWQLGGELRALLVDIESAETLLELETRVGDIVADLHEVTEKLFAAGEVARLDLLQSENQVLEQRAMLLDAEAALVDAERRYSVITGMQRRPASPHREALSAREEVDLRHPLLRYLQSEAALAQSGVEQSRMAAKGNPQLTIGSRRERGDRFQPWTDSVGISLSVPFGAKSVVDARTSAAWRQQADAEVNLLSTRRSLQQSLHEAEHELFVTRQALPLAERKVELGEQRLAMARSAYQGGELTLAQVLLALREATAAERELTLLRLREQRLINEYNQFVGVMP